MATVSAPSHSTRVKSAPGSSGSPDRHAETQAKDWKPEKSYGVGARYRFVWSDTSLAVGATAGPATETGIQDHHYEVGV